MNATTTTHTNLPPPPSPSFAAFPTEILLLIVEQLHLDAKGLNYEPHESLSATEVSQRNRAMTEATTALAALCRTCRRLNKIVKPVLYEEPFLLWKIEDSTKISSDCTVWFVYLTKRTGLLTW